MSEEEIIAEEVNRHEFSGGYTDHIELEDFEDSLKRVIAASKAEDKQKIERLTQNISKINEAWNEAWKEGISTKQDSEEYYEALQRIATAIDDGMQEVKKVE